MTQEEYTDILPDLIRDVNRHSLDRDVSTWSIFYNNKMVRTRSGKISWTTQGDAKKAFHMSFSAYYRRLNKTMVLQNLIRDGIVEFREMR